MKKMLPLSARRKANFETSLPPHQILRSFFADVCRDGSFREKQKNNAMHMLSALLNIASFLLQERCSLASLGGQRSSKLPTTIDLTKAPLL